MINKHTFYKHPEKPSCTDLILTNCLRSFQNSCVIETGLSGFHKMVTTAMKIFTRDYNFLVITLSGSLYKILFQRIWKEIVTIITLILLFLPKTFLIRFFMEKELCEWKTFTIYK